MATGRMLLESSGCGSGTLLNILRYPGQPPPTEEYPVPNANSVEVENAAVEGLALNLQGSSSVVNPT